MPALDPHIVEDEAKQLLAAGEVQTVQTDKGPLGEVGDAPLEVVGLGQLGPLGDQGLALLVEMTATGVELGGPTGHLGAVDHARLVQVGEAAPLCLRAITPALQSSQLGGEQLVVGDRPLSGQRCLASAEQLGTAEQLAYLVEDEGIELVGVDAPLGATAVLLRRHAPGRDGGRRNSGPCRIRAGPGGLPA